MAASSGVLPSRSPSPKAGSGTDDRMPAFVPESIVTYRERTCLPKSTVGNKSSNCKAERPCTMQTCKRSSDGEVVAPQRAASCYIIVKGNRFGKLRGGSNGLVQARSWTSSSGMKPGPCCGIGIGVILR